MLLSNNSPSLIQVHQGRARGAAEVLVGVVDDEAQAGVGVVRRDVEAADDEEGDDGQQQGKEVQWIEVGEAPTPEAQRRLAQLPALAVDMGQEEAGEHEEATGGEEADARQILDPGQFLLIRIAVQGMEDHDVQAEQET